MAGRRIVCAGLAGACAAEASIRPQSIICIAIIGIRTGLVAGNSLKIGHVGSSERAGGAGELIGAGYAGEVALCAVGVVVGVVIPFITGLVAIVIAPSVA